MRNYIAGWHNEIALAIAIAALFCLLTGGLDRWFWPYAAAQNFLRGTL